MAVTKNFNITELTETQVNKAIAVNEAIIIMDAVGGNYVTALTNTPPGSPAEGDLYAIDGSPTGVWASNANELAYYISGGWRYITPKTGFAFWNGTTANKVYYNGSAWATQTLNASNFSGCMAYFLSDVIDDTYPVDVIWDLEEYDTDSFHDNSTNPERLTVPSGVSYVEVGCTLAFTGVDSSDTIDVKIQKNGADYTGMPHHLQEEHGSATDTVVITLSSGPIPCSYSDYFTVNLDLDDSTTTLFADGSHFWIKVVE